MTIGPCSSNAMHFDLSLVICVIRIAIYPGLAYQGGAGKEVGGDTTHTEFDANKLSPAPLYAYVTPCYPSVYS